MMKVYTYICLLARGILKEERNKATSTAFCKMKNVISKLNPHTAYLVGKLTPISKRKLPGFTQFTAYYLYVAHYCYFYAFSCHFNTSLNNQHKLFRLISYIYRGVNINCLALKKCINCFRVFLSNGFSIIL